MQRQWRGLHVFGQRAFGVYVADLRLEWWLLEEMIMRWRWWGVVVEEGFGYVVVMAVVEVVVGGFGYAMELRAFALADGEYRGCIAFLRASLAPC
jgi:hypothetical protein